MSVREELHQLVDELDDQEIVEVLEYVRFLLDQRTPLPEEECGWGVPD